MINQELSDEEYLSPTSCFDEECRHDTAAHDTAAHDTAAHDTAAHDTAAHDTAAHDTAAQHATENDPRGLVLRVTDLDCNLSCHVPLYTLKAHGEALALPSTAERDASREHPPLRSSGVLRRSMARLRTLSWLAGPNSDNFNILDSTIDKSTAEPDIARKVLIDLFNPNSAVHYDLLDRLIRSRDAGGATDPIEHALCSNTSDDETGCSLEVVPQSTWLSRRAATDSASIADCIAAPLLHSSSNYNSRARRFRRFHKRGASGSDVQPGPESKPLACFNRDTAPDVSLYPLLERCTSRSLTADFASPSALLRWESEYSNALPRRVHPTPSRALGDTALWLLGHVQLHVPIWTVGVALSGRWIAVGCQDGTIHIYSPFDVDHSPECALPLRSDASASTRTVQDGRETISNLQGSLSLLEVRADCIESKKVTTDVPRGINVGATLRQHTGPVLALEWEATKKKGGLLLSSSVDCTVRMWQYQRTQHTTSDDNNHRGTEGAPQRASNEYLGDFGSWLCIAVLSCSDWPTAISFLPSKSSKQQRRRVLIGCLDASMKLWEIDSTCAATAPKVGHGAARTSDLNRVKQNTLMGVECSQPDTGTVPRTGVQCLKPSQRCVRHVQTADVITCLGVSNSGELLGVGMACGRVAVHTADDLRFMAEIECHNRKGKASKVTAICWSKDDNLLCATTNDSRVRLVNLTELSCVMKLKGHVNEKLMLKASFVGGDDEKIVCGSEDGFVYLWDRCDYSSRKKRTARKNKERFPAFDEVLTACVVAPQDFGKRWHSRIRRLLGGELMDCQRPVDKFETFFVCSSYKGSLKIFAQFERKNV